MKRIIAVMVMLAIVMIPCHAETLTDSAYIDVPSAMTQDAVVQITANHSCEVKALEPDEMSVALLNSIYDFVWKEKMKPVEYYDELTQAKIDALLEGASAHDFHMTEAMQLQLTGEIGDHVDFVRTVMRLNVEYYIGQLVVVVLGIPQGNGEYVWYPYRGHVATIGEIRWEMPNQEWDALSAQPVSFHVLTDRIGGRGGKIWNEERIHEVTPPSFSKEGSDIITIRRWYDEWHEPVEDDFSVWLVDLTHPMHEEVQRIGKHLAKDKAMFSYFPEERREEAKLFLPEDLDYDTLIAYDVIALRDKDYKDTYGDVNVEITFGTVYDPEKSIVIFAGFPVEETEDVNIEETRIEWYVLRAQALGAEEELTDVVEIALKQLFLDDMEHEPIMLVILSEPLDAETNEN
ncbi:MAG: hypothetical protein E7322_12675 [Clostridiales bacterium]|nr:hypothetical protein [Clostridiales bacterium]